MDSSLWLAAPILLLWANSHGSFIAGLCVLWTYFGLNSIDCIIGSGRNAIRDVLLLGSVAIAATLVTFVNPYGVELHLWLWEALHIPRPEIEDWLPLEPFSREAIGFWIMLATTIAAAWLSYFSIERQSIEPADRLHWPKLAVLILVGVQAVIHVRHLPLLAILWGFWIQRPLNRLWEPIRKGLAEHLAQARAKEGRGDGEGVAVTESCGESVGPRVPAPFSPRLEHASQSFRSADPLCSPLALAACLWTAFVAYGLGGNLSALKVDRDQYPVEAMAFLARHRLEGRTVVTFNWAQYAIGVFAAEGLHSTVAFDGRFRTCYPQEVIDRQFDFLFGEDYTGRRFRSPNSPPVDPERVLHEGDPELVLISRKQRPSVSTMQQVRSDWCLLYQDGVAQIWGRRDVFDDARSGRYLPPGQRAVSEELTPGWVEWPALPTRGPANSTVAVRCDLPSR